MRKIQIWIALLSFTAGVSRAATVGGVDIFSANDTAFTAPANVTVLQIAATNISSDVINIGVLSLTNLYSWILTTSASNTATHALGLSNSVNHNTFMVTTNAHLYQSNSTSGLSIIFTNSGAWFGVESKFGAGVVTVPLAVTWSSTPALNFTTNALQTITLTGGTTFSSANLVAGARIELFVTCDSTLRSLTFPAGWICVTGSKPSSIAASKHGVLTLTSSGTTDAAVFMGWAVEP